MNVLQTFAFILTFILLHNGAQAVDKDAKVLIIGGGPAGIQAAATLVEHGIDDFLILEDGEQLRGSLEPLDFAGHTFAPGFIWGYTPIQDRLEELDVDYHTTDSDSYTMYNEDGEDVTEEAKERQQAMEGAYEDWHTIDYIEDHVRPDLSQKAKLARGGWIAHTDVEKATEWYGFDFYGGKSARDISAFHSSEQEDLFPDEYLILDDRTLAYPLLGDQEELITEEHIKYNEAAMLVEHSDDNDYVTVTTYEGNEYVGEYAIVTSTVGVIQNGRIAFDPPLPPWKAEEFIRYQMSILDPIFMHFEEKFWDDTEYILYASDRFGYYPGFLNLEAEGAFPAGTNILIGFVAGDEALRVEHLTDEEIQEEVVEVLRNIYGDDVPEPNEFYMSRFGTDENLFGNYATWPIGNIPEDAATRLRAHVGRVYFAPEDAADEYIGIPFGSVNEGRASAEAVVSCDEDGECDEYEPEPLHARPLCKDVKPDNPKKYRKQHGKE